MIVSTNDLPDIPTCEQLVKRIEKEAEDTITQTNSLIIPQSKL